jgi:hypothetical protein
MAFVKSRISITYPASFQFICCAFQNSAGEHANALVPIWNQGIVKTFTQTYPATFIAQVVNAQIFSWRLAAFVAGRKFFSSL